MAEEAKVTESTDMKFTDEELQSLQDLQNNCKLCIVITRVIELYTI